MKPSLAHEYEILAIVFVINGTESVLDDLRIQLPGALFLGIPFGFDRAHNREYLQLVQFIQKELRHARRLAGVLRKEFTARDSRTPLLLPLQNFKSRLLEELVRDVQKLRPGEQDYDMPLRKLVEGKGLLSKRDRGKSFFENRNSIRFYGPSKAGARHGKPVHFEVAPHLATCLFNAYFRLGTRYDVNFHYDCQYESGHIGGNFPNCHAATENHPPRTHLNISPNDFIR
jgi:hypothetical protein